jgi:hypothetical protein
VPGGEIHGPLAYAFGRRACTLGCATPDVPCAATYVVRRARLLVRLGLMLFSSRGQAQQAQAQDKRSNSSHTFD